MDTPRSERTSRRRSEGGSGSNNSRRRTVDREDESNSTNGNRPPPSRRGSSAAPPIIAARVSASRGPTTAESTTPTSRIPSEEAQAQAQIITLESHIERLQLRLLEGQRPESRERARAARRELEAMPSPPLFGRNFIAPPRMPNNGLRSPNNGPASPRSPVVRLSQNTAGGANGSGHDGEDTRRDNLQRLSDFVRAPSSEQYSWASLFPPSPVTSRETGRPRNTALDAATTTRPSRPLRSRPTAETSPEPPRFEPLTRPSRGLWRVEDSNQDMNPELETPYEAAASRHFFMTNARLLTVPREAEMTLTAGTRTPNAIPAEDPSVRLSAVETALAEQREWPRTRHDRDIDYASAIFTRSSYPWDALEPGEAFTEAQSEAFARARAANAAVISSTAASTLPEHPVPDRNPAGLIQPETTEHVQLQQFHYDINALANDAGRVSERFRLRRREREQQRHYHHTSTGLDGQKGRPEPLEEADMKLDSECKICFGQIADTVLMPCAHLVICQWCADQIGARTRDRSARHMPHALCPMCRTQVVDRIKIYRG